MRFALIRLTADRHRLLISNHHLLMDGWSAPVLVRELLEAYARGGSAASLPRVTPYRDYLAFIARQDRDAALAAWRESLAGLRRARGLRSRCGAGRGARSAPEQVVLSLGAALSAELNRTARERAVTLNTVMQTAWGILLGRLSGRDDVVFGVTVAGRPAELAGVEQMVGLFINTLPLRMALPPQLPLSELLRRTQEQPVGADGAPACGARRDPAGGGAGRAVRHAAGVRELSGRPRGPRGRSRRPQARPGRGPRRDALSAGADRAAGRANCGCASTTGPTCSTANERGGDRPSAHSAAGGARSPSRTRRSAALPILDAAGARHHPAALERYRACDGAGCGCRIGGDPACAVCRAGSAHAGGDGGGVRGPHADLRRPRRPRQRLAHHLQSLGVGPDVLVGVCAERSLETGGGAAGDPQGRRRLCAARSGVSARAAGLHAGRRRLRRCW